ncbi:MAG TPA: sugar-binding protein [Rariglobus sp.]
MRFDAALTQIPAGEKGALSVVLRDEQGAEVLTREFPFTSPPSSQGTPLLVPLDLGKPGRGYYDLQIDARFDDADGKPAGISVKRSLGVMDTVHRSTAEVREGGYAFGLKWWAGIKRQRELAETMSKLGLQWTRIGQSKEEAAIMAGFAINPVIKVERFPASLYDAERYGPMAEWEKKFGRGAWTLKTLPQKEPYQHYLREWLETVPADQNVFEIWNEPWDKLPPKDFAVLSQWVAEVILEKRPNAVIGPNLFGRTSDYDYDAQVIEAGGLKGMTMVALHPYSEDRETLRGYRQWLDQKTGREFAIYITECGSPSTPQGPARRSELEQARRTVRQGIELYAEGVKAITPHWAGQSEKNPTYFEDWSGFVRKNEDPKPVLLAFANCARLIDGSRYLGDLWFGPNVAAMLFEKKGTHTLVLWTLDDQSRADMGKALDTGSVKENASRKDLEIQSGAKHVLLTDMFGREQTLATKDGQVALTLGEAPVYLVGVGAELAAQASKELRPDRWPRPAKPPRNLRAAGKLTAPPVLDGNFDDWPGAAQLGMVNPRVNGYDCSGIGYLAWDDDYLYVGVDVRDNEMLNTKVRKYLYTQDGVELFVSLKPRDSGTGFGPDDLQFFLTPTSDEGKPIIGQATDREAGIVEDVKGAKFFAGPTHHADKGWAIEAALPWGAFRHFKPAAGGRLALEMRINDADTSHPRWKIDPSDTGVIQVTDPSTWSILGLRK